MDPATLAAMVAMVISGFALGTLCAPAFPLRVALAIARRFQN
jgi:hypothetical protein